MVDQRKKIAVTLELPAEVALWLAENGQALLGQFGVAIQELHWVEAEQRHQVSRDQIKERRALLTRIGRSAYREFRRRLRSGVSLGPDGESRDLTGLSAAQRRSRILLDLADLHQVAPEVIEIAVRGFRKTLDAKVRDRRKRLICRLFLEGRDNETIAARAGQHRGTVVRIIREWREAARSQGLTVKELLDKQAPTPSRPVEDASPDQAETVIDWQAIRKAGGRP